MEQHLYYSSAEDTLTPGMKNTPTASRNNLKDLKTKEEMIKQIYFYDVDTLPNIETDMSSPSIRIKT